MPQIARDHFIQLNISNGRDETGMPPQCSISSGTDRSCDKMGDSISLDSRDG